MTASSCPLSRREVVDRYFLEHRAKVIDIAAFLDRVDRAAESGPPGSEEDFRLAALRRTLLILSDGQGDRARRVLELLSDHSVDPIGRAPMQGAFGAPPPGAEPAKEGEGA